MLLMKRTKLNYWLAWNCNLKSNCIKNLQITIFIAVTDVTRSEFVKVILEIYTNLGLNLNYLWGKEYNGATAVGSCFNGVQNLTKW